LACSVIFDNRQLATFVLLTAFLVWVFSTASGRTSARDVGKQFIHPKVLIPFVLYGLWLVALHWLGWQLNLWNPKLVGESIFWAGASGFALLALAVTEAGKADNFFRNKTIEIVKFTALFIGFLNLKSLSLIGEIVMQSIVTFLVLVRVVAGHNEEHRSLRKPLDTAISLVTLGLLAYTVYWLVHDWPRIDKGQEVRKLLMPIWLTVGAFPFVFVFTLMADYGRVFSFMKATTGLDRTSLRARIGVMLALRTRLLDIHAFAARYAQQAGRARSIRGGMEAVRDFREDRAKKAAAEQARLDRLEMFAGATGIDETRRQLDQREFDATRKALDWLATCQMGWYRNHGARYRADLLEKFDDFQRQGLPGEHGIVMKVRKDGQAWYAYRRTVTGWVLGIGARTAPPDQWFYDGPEPPASYPRAGHGWGDAVGEKTMNWR
jgi:hypothetical protein